MTNDKPKKVAILIPSYGGWAPQFAMSLLDMYMYMSNTLVADGGKIEPVTIVVQGSHLPIARHTLLKKAIDNGFDYALFLDQDMTMPRDTFHRLVAAGKSFIACNYVCRQRSSMPDEPYVPIAQLGPGKPLYTRADSNGLVEVVGCGLGVFLIDLRAFNVAPPWFDMRYDSQRDHFHRILDPNSEPFYTQEDMFFCYRIRCYGHSIYIDQCLSKEIGHIGQFEFRFEHLDMFSSGLTQHRAEQNKEGRE